MEEVIKRWLAGGSGSGSGSGSGDGSGSGSGSGDGDGSGYGYGYGSGYGSGYGYGYGSGDGDGLGYGSGDGSGYGSGYGYGYGDVSMYNGMRVWAIDDIPTIIRWLHNDMAKGFILNGDLTLRVTYVAKVGGCFAHGDTLSDAVAEARAKALRREPIEERIGRFVEQYPSLDCKVSGKKLFEWHNILTGSCSAGRQAFCQDRGLSLESDYSVAEFISLTLAAYGGDVISQLNVAYNGRN